MDHGKYVLQHIDEIDELLHFIYGTPNHNNKEDPLDEMVYILLSRRTRGSAYEHVYEALRQKYPRWEDVANASEDDILSIVNMAGFGRKRARELKNNLIVVNEKFGRYSLDRLNKWGNPKCLSYLTSLEGIGPKSAYCIMMYSLKRKVFPADTHVKRICQRLGIIDVQLNHKEAQTELADLFPKKLRYSLHVNMVAHGRDICRSSNPSCKQCLIAGFCKRNRKNGALKSSPGVMDLFAGPGGMSLGFENAGCTIKWAIEADYTAASTLLYNRPSLPSERIIHGKIETIQPKNLKGERVYIILAGPPCQEFSKVRKNNYGNLGRKELYKEVLRYVREIRPTWVVIENVPGMASHINREYVDRVERGLHDIGYIVKSDLINARHYGIPQNRIRLFFIGRKIFGNAASAAEKSLLFVWNRIHDATEDRESTFRQAISGLPRLAPGEGADLMSPNRQGTRSEYSERLWRGSGIIYNHIARKHNPRDLEAYNLMKPGENALHLHKERPDLMPYSTKGFPTKFYKIRPDHPSPTIVAHLRKDANSFINPFDNRGITPREAARIQSFPDSYRFLGTFGKQFEQIGNAVPPILAEIVARAIIPEIK